MYAYVDIRSKCEKTKRHWNRDKSVRTTKQKPKPNRRKLNNIHVSFLSLFAGINIRRKLLTFFVINRIPMVLGTQCSHTQIGMNTDQHTPIGWTKKHCRYLICECFSFYLCAKWNQIKCEDRVTFAFIMCRNGNYSLCCRNFRRSSNNAERETIYLKCLLILFISTYAITTHALAAHISLDAHPLLNAWNSKKISPKKECAPCTNATDVDILVARCKKRCFIRENQR